MNVNKAFWVNHFFGFGFGSGTGVGLPKASFLFRKSLLKIEMENVLVIER
jgi:hypothetical protein